MYSRSAIALFCHSPGEKSLEALSVNQYKLSYYKNLVVVFVIRKKSCNRSICKSYRIQKWQKFSESDRRGIVTVWGDGQILSTAPMDVAVFVDRGRERLEQILVPYAANTHDDLGLELALRLLLNNELRTLTVLQVVQGEDTPKEISHEFQILMAQLPPSVRDRITLEMVESPEPIQAVIEASNFVDLTIAGTSRAWGIERQTLGRYTDALAIECRSSLLITRRYSQVTSHLSSMLLSQNGEASIDKDDSGVEA
jgi:hypothetical protein